MKLAVVGGGMSGMCAGIAAVKKSIDVTVFERNPEPGKKLLMTGNGRCNLGNENLKGSFDPSAFYFGDTELAKRVLERFDYRDACAFWETIGLSIKSEGALLYPRSMQAVGVRDALAKELSVSGAHLRTGVKVTGLEALEEGFMLTLGHEDGSMKKERYDRVILCGGGRSYPSTGSDGFCYKLCKKLGIAVRKPLPALTRFIFKDESLALAAGARVKGRLSLYIDEVPAGEERGEIQFLKNAVSGIAAFSLSSAANRAFDEGRNVMLYADTFEEESEVGLFDLIWGRCRALKGRTISEVLAGLMNDRLAMAVIRRCGFETEDPADSFSDEDIKKLSRLIKQLPVKVTGLGSYNECQVTAGGICGEEFDDDLMIKRYPGLYAAGELIDVDGVCGGFNLQFALSSGYIAGSSAAEQ